MAIIDYAVIALIFFSALISFFRGIVREALSLVAWIIAIWAGVSFSDEMTPWVNQWVSSPTISTGVSVLVIVTGTLLVLSIGNFILTTLFIRQRLRLMDRLFGLGFGVVRGTLAVSVFMVVAIYFGFNDQSWYSESELLEYFEPLSSWLNEMIASQLPAHNINV